MAAKKRKVKLNKGAVKALAAMVKRYGAKKGRANFYAKARKYGSKGLTPSQNANQVFGTHSHRVKQKGKK